MKLRGLKETFVRAILIVVGLINLIPVVLFFDSSRSIGLYGIELTGESLLILMRHRAILLGMIGTGLIVGAFSRPNRVLVIVLALISKVFFIYLSLTAGVLSPQIERVALTDVGAVVLLLAALWLHLRK